MLILAIDTATEQGSLALVEGEQVLGEYALATPGTFLQHLLPGVEALLAGAGGNFSDLDALAVSRGPGNFTGLRIGLATAQGLAWSRNLPVVAVSTLEVVAAQVPCQPQPVAVLMDAKRREVYLGRYRCSEGRPQALQEPVRLALDALAGELSPPLVLTGPGLTVHEEFLRNRLDPEIHPAPPELRYPQAATLARLALPLVRAGQTIALRRLTPLYLRPAL
jgi:tRNA threonylcarbamoyladenosine biosynthesis protein TsaB